MDFLPVKKMIKHGNHKSFRDQINRVALLKEYKKINKPWMANPIPIKDSPETKRSRCNPPWDGEKITMLETGEIINKTRTRHDFSFSSESGA